MRSTSGTGQFMFPRPSLLASCITVAIMVGAAAPACAQWGEEGPGSPPERSNRQQDLSESVRRVERQTGGQVLAAEPMQFDGREVNRIKVLDDRGRVRVFMDDPKRQERSEPPSTRRDHD